MCSGERAIGDVVLHQPMLRSCGDHFRIRPPTLLSRFGQMASYSTRLTCDALTRVLECARTLSERLLTTSTSSSEREMRGGPDGRSSPSGPFACECQQWRTKVLQFGNRQSPIGNLLCAPAGIRTPNQQIMSLLL